MHLCFKIFSISKWIFSLAVNIPIKYVSCTGTNSSNEFYHYVYIKGSNYKTHKNNIIICASHKTIIYGAVSFATSVTFADLCSLKGSLIHLMSMMSRDTSSNGILAKKIFLLLQPTLYFL